MPRWFRRLGGELLGRADHLPMLARLMVLDWLAPLPEPDADRAIRGEGERPRRAFPFLDERLSPQQRGRLLGRVKRLRAWGWR